MRRHMPRRLAVGIAVGCACLPLFGVLAQSSSKPIQNEYYKGKVVPLADLMEKADGKLDPDAAPSWLVLVTDAGKMYPLLKDDGSRMFFKDTRLLNRPMRLTGHFVPNSQILQVVEVHSYAKGELQEVYYWCAICSIRRDEKKLCDCCGAPMELREVPVNK